MRSIVSMTIFFIVLGLMSFGYTSTSQGRTSDTEGYSRPAILCLNSRVSTGPVDVSMAPAYDWVHAGQQGINLAITNKTNEKLEINWDKTFYQRNMNGEMYPDRDAPAMGSNVEMLHDIVAPGVTFSKTIWPRSGAPKEGRLENRRIFLTFTSGMGGEQHQEILLDVTGENRTCGR